MKEIRRFGGFTLAEMAVVFAIIAVIAVFTMKITKSKTNYVNSFMTYSTITNLQTGVNELIGQGLLVWDGAKPVKTTDEALVKTIPTTWHDGNNLGFCDRLSQIFNIVGTVDCTATVADGTTDFKNATPSFVTTNGMKWYVYIEQKSYPEYDCDRCTSNQQCTNAGRSYIGYVCTDMTPLEYTYLGNNVYEAYKAARNKCLSNGGVALVDEYMFTPFYSMEIPEPYKSQLLTKAPPYRYTTFSPGNWLWDTEHDEMNMSFSRCIAGAGEEFIGKEIVLRTQSYYGSEHQFSGTLYWRKINQTGEEDICLGGISSADFYYPKRALEMPDEPCNSDIKAYCSYDTAYVGETSVLSYYVFYVDIDGKKGNSKLNEDVLKFLVYADGTILPDPDSKAATEKAYLKASVVRDGSEALVKNVSYKEAVCKAARVNTYNEPTSYCSWIASASGCSYGVTNRCSVKITKPGY